jgi:hypothetical protein
MSDYDADDQSPLGHWGVMALASNPPDKVGEVAVRIGRQSHRYSAHSTRFIGVGEEVRITEVRSDGSVMVVPADQ